MDEQEKKRPEEPMNVQPYRPPQVGSFSSPSPGPAPLFTSTPRAHADGPENAPPAGDSPEANPSQADPPASLRPAVKGSAPSGANRAPMPPSTNQAPVRPGDDRAPVAPVGYQPPPHRPRRVGIAGPLLLIVIGSLFLLNNLGLVNWSVWEVLWRFWPVWLVVIGVDMLFGRRGGWGGILALAIVVTLLGGTFYYASLLNDRRPAVGVSETREISQSLQGAKEARVEISSGVSTLMVTAGADTTTLVEGRVTPIAAESLRENFRVEGSMAYYTLNSSSNGPWVSWNMGRAGEGSWDLKLNETTPMSLTVKTGVGRSELDLSRLKVTDLRIESGVGETTLTMPASGQLRARLSSGVGQTSIRIPASMAARIRVETGIGGLNIEGDFAKEDGYYTSPDYASATDRIDLDLQGGVGAVNIERLQ